MIKIKVFGKGDKVWWMQEMIQAVDLPWKENDVQLHRKTIDSAQVTGHLKYSTKRVMEVTVHYHFPERHPLCGAEDDRVFHSIRAAKRYAKQHGLSIVRIWRGDKYITLIKRG